MTHAYVAGVAVQAPGLSGWAAARAVLAGASPYVAEPLTLAPPPLLAANERRRATGATRLALALASEAVEMAACDARALRCVFASSNGDGATVGAILDALTSGDGQVSPTQFHNSVHNAAAGYWAIAAGAREAATCLGCHDWTAAAGLLKAVGEVTAGDGAVLLCLYDLPMPGPLRPLRGVLEPFGAALVLTPAPDARSLARIDLAYTGESVCDADEPTGLAAANPLARILPLLGSLARGEAGRHRMALLDGCVDVALAPCVAADA